MSSAETNATLNQVIVLLNRSLAAYLADARPWMGNAGPEAVATLDAIVQDQRDAADRLSHLVLDGGGDVASGEFPMRFTSLHDLSFEYCLGQLIQRQQQDIQFLEQAVAALERAPLAKSLVEETLGAAKGHLQSLQELTSSPA